MKCKNLFFTSFLIFSFFLNHFVYSQDYDMRNFDYEAKPSAIHLSAEEEKEPAVILSDKRVFEFIPDNNSKTVEYYTFYRQIIINDQVKADSYKKIYFPVTDPKDLIVLKARAISKEGKIIELQKSDLKKVNEDGKDNLIL